MPGINLSQSIQERQAQARVKFFDWGLMVGLAVLILVALTALGVRWYVGTLETKMTELDTLIAQKTATLKGQLIDRLVDFSDRSTAVGEHLQTEPNPVGVLQLVEESVLPSIQLASLRYERDKHQLILSGITKSLKEIAQQMLVFKKVTTVESVQVDNITYDQDGNIKFSLTVQEKKASVPSR